MKTNFSKLMLLALVAMFTFASCEKDDSESSKWIVKLGAQSNTSIGAFYSLSDKKVYTQVDAFNNQAKIDLLCFYEHTETRINDMTFSSPGANITGIYTGDTSVENYTTLNLTLFCPPVDGLTVEEFDLIKNGDQIIETYFVDLGSGNKKAKLLAVDDIYAFKTQDGTFGIFKVLEVSEPESVDGWIKFEIKTYKPTLE